MYNNVTYNEKQTKLLVWEKVNQIPAVVIALSCVMFATTMEKC